MLNFYDALGRGVAEGLSLELVKHVCEGGFVQLLELLAVHALCLLGVEVDFGLHLLFVGFYRALDISEVFVFAERGPGTVDGRHGAFVDGGGVGFAQLEEHLACQDLAVHLLGPDLLEHLVPEHLHVVDELRSELAISQLLHVLQVLLTLSGPYHGKAVFLLKVVTDQPSNFVFLFNCIRCSFLLLERILQILLGRNIVLILVLQSQCKVPDHPQERGKVLTNRIRINVLCLLAIHFQLLAQVNNQ